MRTLLAVLLVGTSLVPAVVSAQWSDPRTESVRTERRIALDVAFVGAVAGGIGVVVAVPLLIAIALDESPRSGAIERGRWEERLIGCSIGAGVSLAMLTVSSVLLAVLPNPGDPIRVGIGPGRLSIEGAF